MGILVFFLAVAFFTYRDGLISVPRGDYLGVMKEREYAASDWKYFLDSISYNRTQVASHGDYFLFRPLFYAWLALGEIFFRENLYALGAISIAFHGLTCFVFYLFASRISNCRIGFSLSLIFLTQSAGMEMVFWRNISPYMAGLFFFSLAFVLIPEETEGFRRPPRFLIASFSFFLACLFHEGFFIVLCALSLLGIIMRKNLRVRPGVDPTGSRRFLALFLVPAALCAAFYAIDFWLRNPGAFFGPDDQIERLSLLRFIPDAIQVSGLFFLVFLMPLLVEISYSSELLERGLWNFSAIPPPLCYGMGIVLVCGTAWIFLDAHSRYRQKGGSLKAFAEMAPVLAFWIFAAGISLGRVQLRGIRYLYNSTYYYYISNFFLLLITAALAKRFLATGCLSIPYKRFVLIAAVLAGMGFCVFGFLKIQYALQARHPFDWSIARTTLEISDFIKKSKGFCYGGTLEPNYGDHLRDRLLYRENCMNRDGEALYAFSNFPGTLWLGKLPWFAGKGVSLDFSSEDFEVAPDFQLLPEVPGGTMPALLPSAFVSVRDYDPVALYLKVPAHYNGGWIVGYRGPNDFLMIDVVKDRVFLQKTSRGIRSWPYYRHDVILRGKEVELVLRREGDDWYLFCDQLHVATLEDAPSLEGKFGFYSAGEVPADFPSVRIWEYELGSRLQGLRPVFRLQTPHWTSADKGWRTKDEVAKRQQAAFAGTL